MVPLGARNADAARHRPGARPRAGRAGFACCPPSHRESRRSARARRDQPRSPLTDSRAGGDSPIFSSVSVSSARPQPPSATSSTCTMEYGRTASPKCSMNMAVVRWMISSWRAAVTIPCGNWQMAYLVSNGCGVVSTRGQGTDHVDDGARHARRVSVRWFAGSQVPESLVHQATRLPLRGVAPFAVAHAGVDGVARVGERSGAHRAEAARGAGDQDDVVLAVCARAQRAGGRRVIVAARRLQPLRRAARRHARHPRDSSLVARRLALLPQVICASPECLPVDVERGARRGKTCPWARTRP